MSGKVHAYILVITSIGKEMEIKEKISELVATEYEGKADIDIRAVFGEYDLVAILTADSLRTVDEIVTRIRRLEGVARTVTLIAV